jgi:hypothetical protein
MLSWRTWEACPVYSTDALGNIDGSESQTCCSKGKAYRDAQMGEFVNSFTVAHASEHKLVYRSEPIGE